MIEYKPVSLAQKVYETLEHDILKGTYAKGEIFSESKLAESLGVSRTPIREAMKRLLQEKLIRETTRGIEVLGVSNTDLEDLLLIKMTLEPYVADGLMKNMTPEILKELKNLIDEQEFFAKKGNEERVISLDTDFHNLMYSISDRPVLATVLGPTHKKLMKFRLASLKVETRMEESVEEHRQLIAAMEEGDSAKVKSLIIEHSENAYNNMKKIFKE